MSEYEYEAKLLASSMPLDRESAIYTFDNVNYALNVLAKEGWEFVGEITKDWHGSPHPQRFQIFKRKLEIKETK